jgi:hypothetical protein
MLIRGDHLRKDFLGGNRSAALSVGAAPMFSKYRPPAAVIAEKIFSAGN